MEPTSAPITRETEGTADDGRAVESVDLRAWVTLKRYRRPRGSNAPTRISNTNFVGRTD